jgi:putative ABC transport system permease protein
VVSLVGLTNGLSNTFKEAFGDDANNVFFVFPGKTSVPYKGYKSNRRIEFDNSDLADIEINFDSYVEYITPRISRGAVISYKEESDNYTTRGVAPGHQYSEKTIMMKGRYVNENDIKKKTKYAVIGRLVEQDLFGDENGMGKFIDISGSAFKVVGVYQDDGGDNEERLIYIPYTTRQLVEKNNDKIDQIVIGFRPEIGYTGAMIFEKQLNTFLRDKKVISPDDQNGLFIRNVADQLKQTQQFSNVIAYIVSFFGIGTLIAGIIGISNIMVFVVKERTKEIGIRKALGATPASVISTILLESVFITTIAGYFGMLVGVVIMNSIGNSLKEDYFITNPYVNIGLAVTATIILILFGALAGYIPARKAARIKPIVALQDE